MHHYWCKEELIHNLYYTSFSINCDHPQINRIYSPLTPKLSYNRNVVESRSEDVRVKSWIWKLSLLLRVVSVALTFDVRTRTSNDDPPAMCVTVLFRASEEWLCWQVTDLLCTDLRLWILSGQLCAPFRIDPSIGGCHM